MYNMNKIHLLVAYYTDNGKVEKSKQQQQTTTSRLINYKVTIYLCTDVLRSNDSIILWIPMKG